MRINNKVVLTIIMLFLTFVSLSLIFRESGNATVERGEAISVKPDWMPRHLDLDINYGTFMVEKELNNMPSFVVSISKYKDREYLVSDYQDVHIVTMTGKNDKLTTLQVPNNIKVWNPTGVFFSDNSDTVYVANYNGHNILEFQIDRDNASLQLVKEIKHPEMKSPENVAVSKDGKYIAVADYDGNSVFLFDNQGKPLWQCEIKQAHGVAIAEGYVYATGLTDREVVKIDMKGNIVKNTGKLGWGQNEYLWPTSIDVSNNGDVVVSDAHTGRLSFLDKELNFIGSIGGNGPGVDLFNFPYSAVFSDDMILVTDSMKGRIIELDYSGKVMNQFVIGPVKISGIKGPVLSGSNGKEYTFESMTFDEISPDLLNSYKRAETSFVGGFNSIDLLTKNKTVLSQVEIDSQNSSVYTGDSFWYVTWIKKIDLGGNDYYIFGSPQHHTFIVYDPNSNIFAINNTHSELFDIWVYDDTVYGPEGRSTDLSGIVKEAKQQFDRFNSELRKGTPRKKAYQKVFYPEKSDADFDNWLTKMMTSKEAKEFLQQISKGADPETAAKKYFFAIKDEPYQYLLENLLVKVLSEPIKPIEELSGIAEIKNERKAYPGYGIAGSIDNDQNTYTGYVEGMQQSTFELVWKHPISISDITIEWLSDENRGLDYKMVGILPDGSSKVIANVKKNNEVTNNFSINGFPPIVKLVFEFDRGQGQNRLLMRNFRVWGTLLNK